MIEAMKQALEALENHSGNYKLSKDECVKYRAVENTLRQAIAEAEKQDKFCDNNCVWTDHHKDCVRASVSWKDMAFARLGAVRDKMRPDDVETVQRFLDGDCTHPQPKREPQFKEFMGWANDNGYDTAHTHDGVKWLCLNPMTADLWKAWQAAHGIKGKNT